MLLAVLATDAAVHTASAQTEAGSAVVESSKIEFVIPPGEESLLAELLGRGAEPAVGCTFINGAVESALVHARYACAGGEIVVDLRHPDTAPADAVRTAKFALAVSSGTAPAGFIEALVARIRAHEGQFEWKEVGQPSDVSAIRTLPRAVPIAIGVVIFAALLWVVRRARRRPPAAG
jgi:hypothetical protein